MISLSPGAPPSEEALFALLAVITDPAAAKKRYGELSAMATKADEATAQAREAQKLHDASKARAEIAIKEASDRAAELDARTASIEQREAQLALREAAHESEVADYQDQTKRQTAALVSRETAVTTREKSAAEREAQLEADRRQFATDRATLDRKLAKAKELIEA